LALESIYPYSNNSVTYQLKDLRIRKIRKAFVDGSRSCNSNSDLLKTL
jgi:hypothetical protein